MKPQKTTIIIALLLIPFLSAAASINPEPTLNNISFPKGYKNWRLIGTSHRQDNNTLRAILGNNIAINAARSGKTNPWPEGSILAKVVWKDAIHPKWETAIVPGELVHIEFMIKNSKTYRSTGTWGYARWIAPDLKPFGEDASSVQKCFNCHITVKGSDYVFTKPVVLP